MLRITRASMVDVMKAPYIRTAFLKGLPYKRVVLKHAIRNALMAPITVIMLHVNWLLGGIVVVEVIFGYPGLGSYLLEFSFIQGFQRHRSRRHDPGVGGGINTIPGGYHLYVYQSSQWLFLSCSLITSLPSRRFLPS